MSCNPCSPKVIVTCLEGEDTDFYTFHIHGLTPGETYYWVLEDERGKRFTKEFIYNANPYSGFALQIAVSEVPAGLFTAERTLWFYITKDVSSEVHIPFLFAHYVEEVQVQINCDEFHATNEEVGFEVMY